MDRGGGDVVLRTLRLLEWRLRRIEYVLCGNAGEHVETGGDSVAKQIIQLEERLSRLNSRSPVVAELLTLQATHPELFEPQVPQTNLNVATDEPDLSTKLALVLSEAPSFPTTASQLTQLNDLPLPPTQSFTRLIAQLPRLAAAEQRQAEQTQQIAVLRKQSAMLLLQWHELFVLGQGRCWAEWDSRLKKAERSVRREEVRRLEDAVP